MNNFIFENSTKVYFGKGCVKEYLVCQTEKYGERVMLCYGGGSIKKNGIYEEVTEKLKSAGKKVFGRSKKREFRLKLSLFYSSEQYIC